MRWLLVTALGVASMVASLAFVWQGYSDQSFIAGRLAAENVAVGKPGSVVDTPEEARVQSDILREHRMENYGTYDKTGRGSPERASFLEALTLENSLNLAQLAFGVTQMAMGIGAYMLLTGAALVGPGLALRPA